MTLIEVQVDRLVGPTHHFGGLGVGNLASQQHAGQISNPQAAALQGLDKMKRVAQLGVPQVILAPQPRPDFEFFKRVGFDGTETERLRQAIQSDFRVLSASLSSSAMWVANAATVSAAVDNRYGVTSLTVANLVASLHRSIEPDVTYADLRQSMPPGVKVMPHLFGGAEMRDEGAANHMRLGSSQNIAGIHVFVYGDGSPAPQQRWPRQTRAACQAIARQHGLHPADTFYLKQHPDAIDAGAFHNDVVAASHHDLMLYHERAFHNADATLAAIDQRYQQRFGRPLRREVVTSEQLSLDDSVSAYLFNSQIVSPGDTSRAPVLVGPAQVRRHDQANRIVTDWCDRQLFSAAIFVDLDQSMAGGGGPACLRLRVPMTPVEMSQIPESVRWSESLDQRLRQIIQETYPTEFAPAHLIDASTLSKVIKAQSALRDALSG